MPKSFNDLAEQAKRVFLEQPVHVDRVFDESGPMSIYLAVWTVVETLSNDEVVTVVAEAARDNRPFSEKAARFDQSNLVNLMTEALIACLQAELEKDDAIRAKEQERMKDR